MTVVKNVVCHLAHEAGWNVEDDGSVTFAVWTNEEGSIATAFSLSAQELDRIAEESKVTRGLASIGTGGMAH